MRCLFVLELVILFYLFIFFVFVGQCEVFVCLGFGHFILCLFFSFL